MLEVWATGKLGLPPNHEAIRSATTEELATWYWEARFRDDPLEARRNEDGEVVFEDTGSPLVDKWEREYAKGLLPDMAEGESDEQRVFMDRLREHERERRENDGEGDEPGDGETAGERGYDPVDDEDEERSRSAWERAAAVRDRDGVPGGEDDDGPVIETTVGRGWAAARRAGERR
jgi:hypothetical protein